MIGRRVGAVAVAVSLGVSGACSSDRDDDLPEAGPSSSTTTSTTSTAVTSAPAAAEAPEGSPTTLTADRLAAVTTEPPAPKVALEVRLGGTVTGTATGDVTARCVRGPDYLDVDVIAEPPLSAGQYGITSLVFSAPGYRGPGRYDAARADDEEWAIGLVDLETEEPLEFFSPERGASGSVVIDGDGRTGSFDIRGLIDVEERTVTVAGRFTCGTVEG